MKSLIENLLAFILYYSGSIKVLRNKGRKYAKILAFHSVSNNENYFVKGTNMWVSASLFVELCAYIRKYYNIISLQKFVESLKEGKIPERSVVITFDDGFADNYHFAYPILKKFQIPATIFLTTEAIDNRKPIWIQKLNYLVNEFGVDEIIGKIRDSSKYAYFERSIGSGNSDNVSPKQLEQFLTYKIAKNHRQEFLTELYSEFDISMEDIFSSKSVFLSWEEIKKMQADGICFGNHGKSHTPFSVLSKDDQIAEVLNSKSTIVQHLDQDFMPFAYPFGQKRDFTNVTKQIVDEAGHSCILTAMSTLNHANTSRMELGRIVIGNIPVYQLAYELEKGVIKSWLKR
jgi:peptidoglycan/xylan/chitin deacetylase (PgdA/CDA1 family)